MIRLLPFLALLGACSVPVESEHRADVRRAPADDAGRSSEPDIAPQPASDEPAPPVAPAAEDAHDEIAAADPLTTPGADDESDDPPAADPSAVALAPEAPEAPESAWAYYRDRYDTDGDLRITREEYTRAERTFLNLDVNQDGAITSADFARRWEGRRRIGQKDGAFFVRGGPMPGDIAPVFQLPATTGEQVALESFVGKKPVVLVFGSFT